VGLIYTARISYSGSDRVDITRKGGSALAPSWPLLCKYLKLRRAGLEGPQTWADYSAAYLDELRALYRTAEGKALLLRLAAKGGTLVCYCGGADGRCHRFLLAGVLVKLGATYEGERPAGRRPGSVAVAGRAGRRRGGRGRRGVAP
jgi:uncharacterized protein YeaO (DUF488 family)